MRGASAIDWRGRKYYAAKFDYDSIMMRVRFIKLIDRHITVHYRKKLDYDRVLNDEDSPRGYHDLVIGCKTEFAEAVEYELRKAERNDCYSRWREIRRKPLYSMSDGLPPRRCDLNPSKRCNHCMDC